MKDHALLLSTPMVLATLRGDKNLTRRTPSCTNSLVDGRRISGKAWKALELDFTWYDIGHDEYGSTWFIIWSKSEERYVDVAPIYNQGDAIWFRETYLKPPEITSKMLKDGADTWPKFDYMASCSEVEIEQYKEWGWKVKSSMFMPKAAARLWATIPSPVICEHLHDITEEQAKREGLACITKDDGRTWKYGIPDMDGLPGNDNTGWPWQEWNTSPVEAFKTLWGKINGPDSWPANPPVYCIPYKLLEAPEPEVLKLDENTMNQ